MRLLPWPSKRAVARLERKVCQVATAQEKLDEAVGLIGEDITAIAEEIARLKEQAPPELDFGRLDELVARVDTVAHPPAVEPETPAEPAPEEPGEETPAF